MSAVYKRREDGNHDIQINQSNKKLRIVPRDKTIPSTKAKNKTFIDKLPPWAVEIIGFEEVMVIRNVQDVCRYEQDPKKLTELFYAVGLIKKSRYCDKHGCQRKLTIKYNETASDQWNRHGGYYYECDGNHAPNNKRKTIKHGTIFDKGLSLIKVILFVDLSSKIKISFSKSTKISR